MNITIRTYYLLLFLFSWVFHTASLSAQDLYPAEKIQLMTDRSLYLSGENISFSGLLSASDDKASLSVVVYIEILTPSGQKINQGKFKISENKFEGSLIIPQDVLSGYYYLRAYSKWMRNGNVNDYSYVLLKLVNPNTEELIEVSDSLIDKSLSIQEVMNDSTFQLNKIQYQAGEKISINYRAADFPKFTKACISLIPSISKNKIKYIAPPNVNFYDSITYYPETRGLTISGKVMSNGRLLPYKKVNIHLKDEENFISVLSDSSGHFYMALPDRYGNNELFVISSSGNSENSDILIDQDYCTRKIELKVPPFSISNEEKKQLLLMAQSSQLEEIFEHNDSIHIPSYWKSAFYGHAYKSIDFNAFVELDSLSQYFTDLPSWVNVKKEKGRRKLSVSGTESELSFTAPLVLIDWVPVDDIEQLLKVDPRRIKKFDVVVKPYVHGGIVYGGIIALFSRNSDFGGFVFPESAMYINYNFFNLPGSSESRDLPFHNTEYWLPDLPAENSIDTLEFRAPAIQGDYILELQMINDKGEKIIFQNPFQVI